MKKMLSLLLSFVMLFTVAAGTVGAQAEDPAYNEVEINGIVYHVYYYSDYATVAGYKGSATKLGIPNSISFWDGSVWETYNVTSIEENAFYNNKKITSVVVPVNVELIGENAFADCTALTRAEIHAKHIEMGAFSGCKALANLTLDGTLSIAGYAFKNCTSLTSVTLPSSLEFCAGGVSFFGCSALKYYYTSEQGRYYAEEGVLFDMIKNKLIAYPKGNQRVVYVMPSFATSVSRVALYENCFGRINTLYICGTFEWAADGDPANYKSLEKLYYTGTGEELYNMFQNMPNLYNDYSSYDKEYYEYYYNGNRYYNGYPDLYSGSENIFLGIGQKILDGKCRLIADYEYYDSAKNVTPPSNVKLKTTSYVYNGNARKPGVTVYDKNGRVIPAKNYKVTYKNNKYPGKASVTVTFNSVGNYRSYGKKTVYFKILPKSTTLKELTAQSKGFTAKWNKQTQITGYQIQYSTSLKYESGKTKTYNQTGGNSHKFTKLPAKKRFYVRIRTYKTVSGTKYFSEWSSSKSIKTK